MILDGSDTIPGHVPTCELAGLPPQLLGDTPASRMLCPWARHLMGLPLALSG